MENAPLTELRPVALTWEELKAARAEGMEIVRSGRARNTLPTRIPLPPVDQDGKDHHAMDLLSLTGPAVSMSQVTQAAQTMAKSELSADGAKGVGGKTDLELVNERMVGIEKSLVDAIAGMSGKETTPQGAEKARTFKECRAFPPAPGA